MAAVTHHILVTVPDWVLKEGEPMHCVAIGVVPVCDISVLHLLLHHASGRHINTFLIHNLVLVFPICIQRLQSHSLTPVHQVRVFPFVPLLANQ